MDEGDLAELYERGVTSWPELPLSVDAFRRAVDEHAKRASSDAPVVKREHAADFFLAVACAEGVRGAADAFRRSVLVHVGSYVGSRAPAEDVEQLVAMRLLTQDVGARPKIAEYSGTGSLGAWVRVVATRIALNLRRGQEARDDSALIPLGVAPEVDFSRFRYRVEFKAAFESALAALSPDERFLLRLHTLDRMRGEDIARLLDVDRSTIMRRLARARERLFEGTRDAMMSKLRLSTEEFASVARDVQSGIDLTLSRLFA